MTAGLDWKLAALICAGLALAAPYAAAFEGAPVVAPAPTSWIARGPAMLDRSETFTFRSAINGNSYKLFVSLPAGYEKSTARYPVLYLLDGNSSWLYARTAIDRMRDDLPGMIVVSIGYDGPSQRWTDYGTPAKSYWEIPADKGASVFLQLIQQEIIPAIDARYRTDPSDRGLGGHSMGGFFSMWTLLTAPESFQRYWISSPTVKWDNFTLRGLADRFAKTHPDVAARVYSDIGGNEDARLADELESLRGRATRGTALRWTHRLVPEVPHSAVPAADIVPALYNLYGRPVTAVSAERLRAVSGDYALSDKVSFTLTTDGKTLYLANWKSEKFPMMPAPERTPVLAETPNLFFIRMIGLEFRVPDGGTKVGKLDVARHFFTDPMPLGTAKRVGP